MRQRIVDALRFNTKRQQILKTLQQKLYIIFIMQRTLDLSLFINARSRDQTIRYIKTREKQKKKRWMKQKKIS